MNRSLILPAIAVMAFSFMVWHLVKTHRPTPDVLPPVEPARSPYSTTIAGAGLVEPRSENIQVAAIVPGTVAEVRVKVCDRVNVGDVLFRLDDRQRTAELAVQRAHVRRAEAELSRWEHLPRPEDLAPSEARVEKVLADLMAQQDQLDRTRELVTQNVLPEQDLVLSEQATRAAKATLSQARSEDVRLKAGAWEEDLLVARAELLWAQELLRQAEMEVERLMVRAPIRGTILKVNVRPGEFAGTPAGAALLVMGDLDELHVRVDIDEQDLPRFRRGLPGQGYVRGDASAAIPLRFVRVEPFAEPKKSLTNSGSERVDTRVLQVIYAIEGATNVYVGQQIDVFLDGAPLPGTDSSEVPIPDMARRPG